MFATRKTPVVPFIKVTQDRVVLEISAAVFVDVVSVKPECLSSDSRTLSRDTKEIRIRNAEKYRTRRDLSEFLKL